MGSGGRTPERNQLRKPSAKGGAAYKKPSLYGGFLEKMAAAPWLGIWNLALGTGGLLLVAFFGSINFLPDLDVKALVGTLASVAAVAVFVAGFMGAGFMLPTLFLELEEPSQLKSRFLLEAFLGVSAAVVFVASLVHQEGSQPYLIWIALVIIPVLIFLAWAQWWDGEQHISLLKPVGTMYVRAFLWMIWALTIPIFLFSLSVYGEDIKDWEAYLLLFAVPFVFAVISIVVAMLPKANQTIGRIVAGLGSLFLFGLLTKHPIFLSQATVSALGLSVDRPVTLILNEVGCNAFNMSLEQSVCSFNSGSKLGRVNDVKLISRIGAQVVLHWRQKQMDSKMTANNWRRIVLRKEDVLSWSYDFGPRAKSDEKKPQ